MTATSVFERVFNSWFSEMGGEMEFYQRNAPIEDVVKYKQIVNEIRNDFSIKFGKEYILQSWRENEDIKQDVERNYANRGQACYNYLYC